MATVSAAGKDSLDCIINNAAPCRTFNYAIQHGANIIQLASRMSNQREHIQLTQSLFDLEIIGNSFVMENYNLTVESNSNRTGIFRVKMKNMKLRRSHISVGNIAIVFSESDLNDIVVTDIKQGGSTPNHVQVEIEQSTWLCNRNHEGGISLTNMAIVKLEIRRSELSSCGLNLMVSDLYLNILSSIIRSPDFRVIVNSPWNVPTWVQMHDSRFINASSNQSRMYYEIRSSDVEMSIDQCQFTSLSIDIMLDSHFYGESFGNVSITRTVFENALGTGNGGALHLLCKNKASSVIISDSSFLQNRVLRNEKGELGVGGAVFIDGNSVDFRLRHSLFKATLVTTMGSALYASKGISISIDNCTFDYDIKHNIEPLASIISVEGTALDINATFVIVNSLPDTSQFNFRAISVDKVYRFGLTVNCPHWYRHNNDFIKVSDDTSGTAGASIDKFVYECLPCSDGKYTPSTKENILVFSQEENSTSMTRSELAKCIDCEYGAFCSGNNIIPRPNYWGYWNDGSLHFKQCPPGYCCTGNDNAPCMEYDVCAANRIGTLCGECKKVCLSLFSLENVFRTVNVKMTFCSGCLPSPLHLLMHCGIHSKVMF